VTDVSVVQSAQHHEIGQISQIATIGNQDGIPMRATHLIGNGKRMDGNLPNGNANFSIRDNCESVFNVSDIQCMGG
jgi:hypothetical protein